MIKLIKKIIKQRRNQIQLKKRQRYKIYSKNRKVQIQKQTKKQLEENFTKQNTMSFQSKDQNIFLTSTFSAASSLKFKKGQQINFKNEKAQTKQSELENLQKNIIEIIQQFKSLPISMQITHQFNEILYNLDTQPTQKKTISSITTMLRKQTNPIKLQRLYNRLKALKKQLNKTKIQKQPERTLNKTCYSQGLKKNLTNSEISNSFYHTLPSQNKQNQQWKQKIIEEIAYKQRICKIQSQTQKHSKNKEQYMKKRLQKVKDMNKKASQIFQKNKKLYKQKINKYKYQQLFDPSQIDANIKKRAQKMNKLKKQKSTSKDSDMDSQSDGFPTEIAGNNLKIGATKEQIYQNGSQNNLSKKDLGFENNKPIEKVKSQDIKTLKNLKNQKNYSVKMTKSVNRIVQDNYILPKSNFFKSNSQYTTPIAGSFEYDRKNHDTLIKNIINSPITGNNRHQIVKQKKEQQQQQKFNKMIAEAVKKQEKIIKISQQKNIQSKKRKNSPNQSFQNDDMSSSFQKFTQKRVFKKIFPSKKQMMDKQRQILTKIQDTFDRKEQFLQQRVNRIRQQLKKQEEKKQAYKKYWEEYISLTENASIFQSRNLSPNKRKLWSRQFSTDKKREEVIKNSFMKKVKQHEGDLQQKKLGQLSLGQLKKQLLKYFRKLDQIQKQQKRASQQNFGF